MSDEEKEMLATNKEDRKRMDEEIQELKIRTVRYYNRRFIVKGASPSDCPLLKIRSFSFTLINHHNYLRQGGLFFLVCLSICLPVNVNTQKSMDG